MHESYFHTNDEHYFLIHSELKPNRPTLLFLHGLGDAHIDFRFYLSSKLADYYNILIPDLLGYGKSSAAQDYSFEHQIQGIEQHLDYLQKITGIKFNDFILVAHSMGGIHATLLCESKLKNEIKAFINVEGSITQFGSFIATSMTAALKTIGFAEWFTQFKQEKTYEKLALQYACVRPYYAALEFCNPDAFRNNAMQMHDMSIALTGKYTNIIGKKYTELSIPRVYCYGDSMCNETIEFLNEQHLATKYFPCKHHFLLAACQNEFVSFIHDYLEHL